jgi:hypothetical protein
MKQIGLRCDCVTQLDKGSLNDLDSYWSLFSGMSIRDLFRSINMKPQVHTENLSLREANLDWIGQNCTKE